MKLVTVTIDGIKTEAEDRTPLIQVAQKGGVKIRRSATPAGRAVRSLPHLHVRGAHARSRAPG